MAGRVGKRKHITVLRYEHGTVDFSCGQDVAKFLEQWGFLDDCKEASVWDVIADDDF